MNPRIPDPCPWPAAAADAGDSDNTRMRLVDCTRYGCKLEVFYDKKVRMNAHVQPLVRTPERR